MCRFFCSFNQFINIVSCLVFIYLLRFKIFNDSFEFYFELNKRFFGNMTTCINFVFIWIWRTFYLYLLSCFINNFICN